MAKLDEAELKAKVAQEISAAESYATSDMSADRERAINYYNGLVPDVPTMPGRSAYVSRDVSNVIGWTLPGIMRVFTASDRMIDCLPENPEDDETCEQAADYINYSFWRDNLGYKILWDATHDSLLNKDGIVKQYWDTQEKCTYTTYTGLSEDQVAVLANEDGVEIIAQSEGQPFLDQMAQPQMGPDGVPVMPEPVMLYDVKIKRVTSAGRLKYEVVEPENFLIDRNALSTEDARFVAHRMVNCTRSDLIEMGFEREVVDAIPSFNSQDNSTEYLARRNGSSSGYEQPDMSMDRVDLYECYIKADINDDGVAEAVKVFYAGDGGGGEILDWEEWDDELPFDKISCNPVPHRWSSDSLADEVMDLQKFKTVIGRQMFDNMYQVNMPTPIIEAGSVENMDAVVNPGIGTPIITKPGKTPPSWNVTPFIGDKAMMALQYLDSVIEMRTGVSRGSMSLDPETLQNQTATSVNAAKDSSYSQIELIARNQAELGWKPVFAKSLRIIVKNQDRPRTIRLRNEWVDMDPRHWNTGMDVTINVGLGTGSRDRDMAMLNNILQTQMMITDRFAAGGLTEQALDMVPKLNKTLVKMAEAAGIKSPETYYPEIEEEELQAIKQQMAEAAQQPDPAMQAEQAKLQAEMQMSQAKMQLDMQMEQARMTAARDKEMAQMQADMQVKAVEGAKAERLEAQKLQYDGQKFQQEQALAREKMAMDYRIAVMKIEHDTQTKAFQASQQVARDMQKDNADGII